MRAAYAIEQRAGGIFDLQKAFWAGLLMLAVAVYTFGLGGQYIPTNGDELVYAHIARLTAASGHWLPLASELDHMRNTKPPLLFWQAMVAGGWGQHWTLLALRLPSLIYTLLITALVAGTVHTITRNLRSALIAACVYLGFFCTFRYGRPYLTSAAETFWLDLPMFALLWARTRVQGSYPLVDEKNRSNRPVSHMWKAYKAPITIAIVACTGIAWGLGSAYKSFALIAPASAALWCALLLSESRFTWRFGLHTSVRVAFSVLIGVGLFALWFVLDPDPAAVWQEFVIGENAAKMNDKQGYWHIALYGGDYAMWAQLLAYVQNAGLLAFVVLGLAWLGGASLYRRITLAAAAGRAALPAHLWVLIAWLAVWLIVFTIPSQRSARYVIPAMPAVAILLALYWDRIARAWFAASLVLIGLATLVAGRIAWVAHDLDIASNLEFAGGLAVVLLGAGVTLAGLFNRRATRACAVAACLIFYACFNLTTAPLDGPQGRYSAEVSAKFSNARIAVPSNFNAQWERFQFLLPGQQHDNRFVPYDMAILTQGQSAVEKLRQFLSTHDAVVWGQASSDEAAPPCLPDCDWLASRWVVKERHKSGDITLQNLWYPHTWLFSREWLVAKRGATH